MSRGRHNSGDIRTRRAILDFLKSEGAVDVATLAARFGVTPMAIRQHLRGLQAEGLVKGREIPRPRGRPATEWRLTEAASRCFPDAHAALTSEIIEAMRQSLDKTSFQKVLDARAGAQRRSYEDALAGIDTVGERLGALAEIRSAEGYMCHVEEDGAGWRLIEKHCPICIAAKSCQGLCESEIDLFRTLVGPAWRVERSDHLIAGATRCVYRIAPA